MTLKPGSRWKSAVCNTEAVVVRPPAAPLVLECGGVPMLDMAAPRPASGTLSPGPSGGSLLGKRYADEASGLEVLCTKAGTGALSADGRPMLTREAKKLPSSD